MALNDYDIHEFKDINEDYLIFTVMNKHGSTYKGICDNSGNVLLEPIYGNIEYLEGFNSLLISKYANLPIQKSMLLPLKDIKCGSYAVKKYEILNNCVVTENYDSDIKEVKYLTITCDIQNEEKKHIVIDKDGNIVYTTVHDISYCNDDMFLEKRKDTSHEIPYYYFKFFYNVKKKKHLSQTGKYSNSDIIGNVAFYGGLCRLGLISSINENRYFYIDTEGNVYGNYYYCTDFHKDKKNHKYRAIIRKNNTDNLDVIDSKFNTIFTLKYNDFFGLQLTDFNVYIIIDKLLDTQGVVNFKGDIIIPDIYNKITFTSNGIISCIDNTYYNLNGNKLNIDSDMEFEDINDNICLAKKVFDGHIERYAILDNNGNKLFNKWFEYIDVNREKEKIITANYEVSLTSNNTYEYTRYSVIDFEGNIIFSYPTDKIFDNLLDLYTTNHEYYIGKTNNKDEYVLLDKEGREIKRFISKDGFNTFGAYFTYYENGKCNLNDRYGNMIFGPIFDSVEQFRPINNVDYINIINDKSFEYYKDGEHYLYIDNGNYYDRIDLNKKKSLIRRLFRR